MVRYTPVNTGYSATLFVSTVSYISSNFRVYTIRQLCCIHFLVPDAILCISITYTCVCGVWCVVRGGVCVWCVACVLWFLCVVAPVCGDVCVVAYREYPDVYTYAINVFLVNGITHWSSYSDRLTPM